MVTYECPWCAEPAVIDASSFAELTCDHCAVAVEIAGDTIDSPMERAA